MAQLVEQERAVSPLSGPLVRSEEQLLSLRGAASGMPKSRCRAATCTGVQGSAGGWPLAAHSEACLAGGRSSVVQTDRLAKLSQELGCTRSTLIPSLVVDVQHDVVTFY